jgi:hypothetical protein
MWHIWRLQHHPEDFLVENQWTPERMVASEEDLVRILVAPGLDKDNISTSLGPLEVKGLVTTGRTPGGQAEAAHLTPEGRNGVALLTASCE